jgi:hypothetical protein
MFQKLSPFFGTDLVRLSSQQKDTRFGVENCQILQYLVFVKGNVEFDGIENGAVFQRWIAQTQKRR